MNLLKPTLIGALSIAVCLACGDQQAADQEAVLETISAYLEALDRADYSAAHSMLASSIQARLPHDAYVDAHESLTPPSVKNASPTQITYGAPSVSPYRALVPVSMSVTAPAVVALVQGMQQRGPVEGDQRIGKNSIDLDSEYELIREESGWRVVLNEGAVALEEQAIANANGG